MELVEFRALSTCKILIMMDTKTTHIPVLLEYLHIFPKELPGLPPNRAMEFSIDLLPHTTPISKEPYQMEPIELAEVKKQLQELKDCDFI